MVHPAGRSPYNVTSMDPRRPAARVSCALVIAAFALLLRSPAPFAEAPAPAGRPRLVVIISVDQMRGSYVEDFIGQWSSGLRRLVERGAWYRRAAYPYLNTVTCAGHATISTGAVPAVHGMVLNEWWERESQRPVHCTEDARAPIVTYGEPQTGGHSSARLQTTTLADEMRGQLSPAPRVVTLSIKPRSAIMLAGHAGDAVTWREAGTWATSVAFSPQPVPAVAEWLEAHPVSADRGRVWERSLPFRRYLHDDSPLGKKPPEGWGRSLPHRLMGDRPGRPMGDFNTHWQMSPFADEYLAGLAMHLIERMKLGQQASTDFLGVSFSAVDSIGHNFGPESHEVQDALIRLDAAIGRMLAQLDRLVGPDRYVVGLSADHGVSSIPEQVAAAGQDGGRLRAADVSKHVERVLQKSLGPGEYVARMFYTDLYFRPGVYNRMIANPPAMTAAIEALRLTPGIARVFRGDELARGMYKGDRLADAARLSYFAGRSGDLVLAPKPNWIMSNSAATHGTANPYDTNVPVIFMGYGIKPGTYDGDATPADVAPTLARLAGVRLPRATGRVLTEAMASEPRGESADSAPRAPGSIPSAASGAERSR